MSRPTARKYLTAAQPPDELQAKHPWRTRDDPLEELGPPAEAMLAEAPDWEAKALFEPWLERSPGAVAEKHLRTFQRRVKLWRLPYGPDPEVFFAQDGEAGRAMQLDWTNAGELAVTMAGQPDEPLLCHCVWPHSNGEWAPACRSESLLSLRQGVQEALHRWGKVPRDLRVDHRSAAPHRVGGGGTGREFNEPFVSRCAPDGVAPRTIGIDRPNENGDGNRATGIGSVGGASICGCEAAGTSSRQRRTSVVGSRGWRGPTPAGGSRCKRSWRR